MINRGHDIVRKLTGGAGHNIRLLLKKLALLFIQICQRLMAALRPNDLLPLAA